MMPGEKEIVFVWVPGKLGISGNSAAASAPKDALDGDLSKNTHMFSDLNHHLNNYFTDL